MNSEKLAAKAAFQVKPVGDDALRHQFSTAGRVAYQGDSNWVPPLPGEERDTFDPRRNPSLQGVQVQRWVLLERGEPVGRIAAFAPSHRPGVGYFGFFESPDDVDAARLLLGTAEEWLMARGRRECYGPIAVTPRDRIGLLIDGFEKPAVIFTPYNPPYYSLLLEAAGWTPSHFLRGYGWSPDFADPRGIASLGEQASTHNYVRIRSLRLDRMGEEINLFARLINETLASAWHFDPVGAEEAARLALLLRLIIDPSLALVAEDDSGPCGVALAVPDANWLWRRAGGRLFPFGWARVLRYRRRVPRVRVMALGLASRAQGTRLVARLISQLIAAGVRGGYMEGELSQVYEENIGMSRMLDRMGLPVVRRYAVFARQTG